MTTPPDRILNARTDDLDRAIQVGYAQRDYNRCRDVTIVVTVPRWADSEAVAELRRLEATGLTGITVKEEK